tara:strand:- start:237 stop:827 length:591 start_codon:yes stop_codon:yes gene_type:complete
MILNKVIFGIFLFFVLYYFSDRKNISWCLYGVVIYIILLIAIEYLNDNNDIRVNQQIEANINTLTNKSQQYLNEQKSLATEHFQNYLKLNHNDRINSLPKVKYGELLPGNPKPFNNDENLEKKLTGKERVNVNKLDILNNNHILGEKMKPKLDNIQVYNLDYNNGLVLDDSEAYKYNVNNQLYYSMFGGITNKKTI